MTILPGKIVLMGSGETSINGGRLFEAVTREIVPPLQISILETPAGYELNSEMVARRVGDYLSVRLQNQKPTIQIIPARKKGTAFSPDSDEIIAPIMASNLIFMGAGSPSYAVRQLKDSKAYAVIQAAHRQGAVLALASAATIAFSEVAMPVYEIYKVGEDVHWKPGLGFFAAFGLKLVIIPHWNNNDGGDELDTSRCFMGKVRFDQLSSLLEEDVTILGLDEHTGLVMDMTAGSASVMGKDEVHIIRQRKQQDFRDGEQFPLSQLGGFHLPTDLAADVPQEVWTAVADARQTAVEKPIIPKDVLDLVALRQEARVGREWKRSDELRQEIIALGWQVNDTPNGPEVIKI